MLKYAVLAIAVLSAAGCSTTRAEQISAAQETCRAYGFTDGTEQFSECVMRVDTDQQDRKRAALAGFMMSQQANRPVTCNTTANVYGSFGTSSTTCR
jgi:hypothetical protein